MSRPSLRITPYRAFESVRIRVNDSLVTQRIAIQLADGSLSTASSGAWLKDEFPALAGGARLHRRVADVRTLMAAVEPDWSRMALPYVLSVHEAFIGDLVQFLRAAGRDDHLHKDYKPRISDLKLFELHAYAARCAGSAGGHKGDFWRLFDWLRELRNVLIHDAGRDTASKVAIGYSNLPPSERGRWERLTGRSFAVASDGSVVVETPEVNGALAVSDRIAQLLVRLVAAAPISSDWWADYIVGDYRLRHPSGWLTARRRPRKVLQYARSEFGLLATTEADIAAAVIRA